jgi:hypothetical protein
VPKGTTHKEKEFFRNLIQQTAQVFATLPGCGSRLLW